MQAHGERRQARVLPLDRGRWAREEEGRVPQKDAPEEDEEERTGPCTHTVSWQTVHQYVAAMVSLWEDQRGAGVNSHSRPRGGALKEHGDDVALDGGAEAKEVHRQGSR